MRRLMTVCTILLATAMPGMADETVSSVSLTWNNVPALPKTKGLGGAFAGVHKGALIVAGGANFPANPPWGDEPGQKVWYKQIYILEDVNGTWNTQFQLPRRLAYGASVTTADGLLLIGGSDDGTDVNDVYRLRWQRDVKKLVIDTLPSLPQPCSNIAAGRIGSMVYVVASRRGDRADRLDRKYFWALDLAKLDEGATWTALEPWPGPPREQMVVAVQSAGTAKKSLYMFSGYNPRWKDGKHDLAKFEFFTDAWRYDPAQKTWRRCADLPIVKDSRNIAGKEQFAGQRTAVAAASAINVGQAHILVFSGSSGRYITRAVEKRPVFPTDVLAYHTITDTWTVAGQMPYGVVTTNAMSWQGKIVIPSGETRPGVRNPNVMTLTLEPAQTGFGWVNYTVLIVYLGLVVGMGIYFSRRENNTDDFFLAGKRIPWWAAGLSIYATQLSAITFISSPALSYANDWVAYPQKFAILLMAPVVIVFYLPFFRRLNVTTAYEYLERRFDVSMRLVGSASFILFQLARMAIVIYLPALALSTVAGMNIYMSIIIMGVLSTIYTALGGMEAVVWTDVLQTFVLMGGLLLALVLAIMHVGGVGEMYTMAAADGKWRMFDWSLSVTDMVTWSVLLGVFFLQFPPYTTDQSVIQRYMTTKDEQAAGRAIWLNGLLAVPVGVLFFLVGTALFVFFKEHPSLIKIGMSHDEVFPLYVVRRLPVGVCGLVIAGIFAASMSSLDSSLHSIATAVTTDFYRRFRPNASEQTSLLLARVIVVTLGLLSIAAACLLATMDIRSLFVFFQKVVGLLGSGLAGVFMLGIFTRRTTTFGALTGLIVSSVLLAYVTFFTPLHPYVYGIVGIGSCVIVGYAASWLTPKPSNNKLAGLTFGK